MSLIALTFLSSTLRQPLELLSCYQPRFQPLSKYPILSKQVAEVFLSPGTSYLRHGVSHNKTKEKKNPTENQCELRPVLVSLFPTMQSIFCE